ncbi:25412_t:CDS:2, partial [Racocetra persica]
LSKVDLAKDILKGVRFNGRNWTTWFNTFIDNITNPIDRLTQETFENHTEMNTLRKDNTLCVFFQVIWLKITDEEHLHMNG